MGLLAWGAVVSLGCSVWREESTPPSELPAPQMSPDAVTLEIATLYVAADDPRLGDELWRHVDEQHLPLELRQQLSGNGLRCGRIGAQLPPALEELLAAADETDNAEFDPAARNYRRRLQTRRGRRSEIVASPELAEVAVLLCGDDGVTGRTFRQANCVLAMRVFPTPDGAARVELTPEVHHGSARPQWIGQDGAFRLQAGRPQEVFRNLRIDAQLAPGQTLVLAATPEVMGLGRWFFTAGPQRNLERRVLLIRLAQTQRDDRFAPWAEPQPLATPTPL